MFKSCLNLTVYFDKFFKIAYENSLKLKQKQFNFIVSCYKAAN